ncbi:MAG: response regulator [Rhodospirillales bacterium]|nr:response regulator [Rhodospirillales bacterium]
MVVEDDDEVRQSAVLLFENMGFDIEESTTADEALVLLKSGSDFNLVFSDVFMPGTLSGFGLANECARSFPEIKFLLASGHPDEELKKLDDWIGRYNLLHKPFTLEELRAELDKMFAFFKN